MTVTHSSFRGPGLAPFALLACALLACGDASTGREPLPDWSDGYERDAPVPGGADGGVAPPPPLVRTDAPEDSFALLVSRSVEYPTRLRRAGTNDPCAVSRGAPREAIDCVLDVNELDLSALGFSVDVVAPKGLCDFILYDGFLFENWQVGAGPSEVSYTVEPDGTLSHEVNSAQGEPRCDYDYSWQYPKALEAPNCCTGGYTLRITSKESGETSESSQQWDPDLGRCYEGGAHYYSELVLSKDGFPLDEWFYIGGDAKTKQYAFDGTSEEHLTNLPLANYWDPQDHGGDMPAAYRGAHSKPYYSWVCADDAEEWRAQIRLLVREWNEEAQYDVDGDSDTTGVESSWGTPIDDLEDWADATPDAVSFPELPPVR